MQINPEDHPQDIYVTWSNPRMTDFENSFTPWINSHRSSLKLYSLDYKHDKSSWIAIHLICFEKAKVSSSKVGNFLPSWFLEKSSTQCQVCPACFCFGSGSQYTVCVSLAWRLKVHRVINWRIPICYQGSSYLRRVGRSHFSLRQG